MFDSEVSNPEIDTDEVEITASPLEWDGEVLDAAEALRSRGAIYADYVINKRAIPDIRDGLKPVQRRTIFSMLRKNQVASSGTTKCARIVGDVMGQYHPHGDSSIYEALVRMGQDFSVNLPLIHPQGNFGSVDNDPPAAMRYTEAKLAKISSAWKEDLRPEIVEYAPNFDESTSEATVLPVNFPNLLVNGTMGLAWGISCSFPTHNLGEVIDATLLLADNRDAKLKQILKRMPGPDYPTRGIILDPEGLEEAYATGRGTFKLQAKYHIENLGGSQKAVVITELPYNVAPSDVLDGVAKLARDGLLSEIATGSQDRPVNLSGKHGIKLIIKCKRGGNPQALAAQLLKHSKHTKLQQTQSINFTVLRDDAPARVGLMDLLLAFLDFRHEVVTKRLEYEKSQLLKDLHRLTALRAASDVIDRVIKIIRGAEDDAQAVEQLKKLVKVVPFGKKKSQPIDDEQAEYILSMQLRRLNQLNQFKLDEEIKNKTTRILEIEDILATPKKLTEIVKQELREIKKTYGQPRKTALSGGAVPVGDSGEGPGALAAAMPKTDVSIYASAQGFGVAVARDHKAKSIPLALSSNDTLLTRLDTDSDQELHCITEQGKLYRVRAAELGLDSKKNKGRAICAMDKSDRLAGLLVADQAPFLLFVTALGQVKRAPAEAFKNSGPGGMDCMGLADDDRIIAVIGHDEKQGELLVHTAQGKALRTSADALAPKKTPSASGMALIKLSEGDEVVCSTLIDDKASEVLVLHREGSAKRVAATEYPTKGRGGGGVQSVATDKPAKAPAGPVALAVPIAAKAKFSLLTAQGQVLALEAAKAPEGSRGSGVVSKPWLALGPGDRPQQLIAEG